MENQALLRAREILDQKIEEKKLRRTPERYRILEEIYQRDDHFEVETLLESLVSKNFVVSRATIYNVLELLVEFGLVTKHQFGNSLSARYEKAFGRKQHSHLICTECGKVLEFCDPRLQNIQNMVSEFHQMEIFDHSLVFYGKCKEICEHKSL
jgi:Fur family transcriptional regulator, ferric uptake regulator